MLGKHGPSVPNAILQNVSYVQYCSCWLTIAAALEDVVFFSVSVFWMLLYWQLVVYYSVPLAWTPRSFLREQRTAWDVSFCIHYSCFSNSFMLSFRIHLILSVHIFCVTYFHIHKHELSVSVSLSSSSRLVFWFLGSSRMIFVWINGVEWFSYCIKYNK